MTPVDRQPVNRLNPQLLTLLCDQGKYAEAEALVDRHVARIDHEIDQERKAREGGNP